MIIYFSGTGNSKYAADILGKELNDKVVDAGRMIKKEIKGEFQSESPLVFVSPTYAWKIPHVFESFIRKASFKGVKKAYFIMTCGDDIGDAETSIIKLCNEAGLEYMGVGEVIMPENYIAMFKVPDEEESEEIIKKAEPVIKEHASSIKEGIVLQHNRISINDRIKSVVINPLFYTFCVKAKKFKADDRCISCGKCASVCPLNNIKLIDGIPQWGSNCTHCMACISYCPTEAIEYGKSSIGKPRYRCREL